MSASRPRIRRCAAVAWPTCSAPAKRARLPDARVGQERPSKPAPMPFTSSKPWHARLAPWLGLAALIIVADQATKILIERVFDFGDVRPVTSFFNLVLTYNK